MIAKSCPEYSLSNPETLVTISGSGNVAQYAALKVISLGAKVLTLSDSHGSLVASKGFTSADVVKVGALKLRGGKLEELVQSEKNADWTYHAGKRPWTLVEKVHVALPCATQNEVSGEEAEALIKAGARIVAEGSNMVGKSSLYPGFLIADKMPFYRMIYRAARRKRSTCSRLRV